MERFKKNQLRISGRRSIRIWLLFSLLCWLLTATGAAAEVQVTAELNPTEFAVDQAARFTVTVTGADSAKPKIPVMKGLHFGYPTQSKQFSSQTINGKAFSTITISFSFIVQAEREGQYVIPPFEVIADGRMYTTPLVTCTVLLAQNAVRQQIGGGQQNNSAARLGSDEAKAKKIGFMRIMPESEQIYSGQIIPFTLKAYFHPGRRVTLKSAPRPVGENFLLHSLDEKPQQRQERFNGEVFTALTWQGTMSAVKEGTAPLVMEMDAEVLVRAGSRQHFDPFGPSLFDDPFFGDIFGRYSSREIKIVSLEKSVTVLDLPAENRPDDFKGAIGTFNLAVSASPLDGKVGDPVTLKMQITGSGNFDMVQAPQLTESEGWKTYPASDSFTEQKKEGGKGAETTGVKFFEQAVVPIKNGLIAVPQVKFSYFDPSAEEYVTLTGESIPLVLQDAPVTAESTDPSGQPPANTTTQSTQDSASTQTAVQPVPNLAPLHTELGRLVPTLTPLYQKIWFQVLMVLALLCLFAALLLYLRRKKLENNPSILRQKQVKRQLAQHYQAMHKAIVAQDQERFQQHCRTAIQQRTAEVWGLEPEAITSADLEQRLPEDAPLRNIFSRLEQSGYAGEQLAQADLKEILQTTRNELDKLVKSV